MTTDIMKMNETEFFKWIFEFALRSMASMMKEIQSVHSGPPGLPDFRVFWFVAGALARVTEPECHINSAMIATQSELANRLREFLDKDDDVNSKSPPTGTVQ